MWFRIVTHSRCKDEKDISNDSLDIYDPRLTFLKSKLLTHFSTMWANVKPETQSKKTSAACYMNHQLVPGHLAELLIVIPLPGSGSYWQPAEGNRMASENRKQLDQHPAQLRGRGRSPHRPAFVETSTMSSSVCLLANREASFWILSRQIPSSHTHEEMWWQHWFY